MSIRQPFVTKRTLSDSCLDGGVGRRWMEVAYGNP